jgi:hypothetical protein
MYLTTAEKHELKAAILDRVELLKRLKFDYQAKGGDVADLTASLDALAGAFDMVQHAHPSNREPKGGSTFTLPNGDKVKNY